MPISEERFYNLPIQVEFAGFRSDTLTLQRNGWDLSIEQSRPYDRAGVALRLALRHEKARLIAVSLSHVAGFYELASDRYLDFLQKMIFSINYVNSLGHIHTHLNERPNFLPFDATPFRASTTETALLESLIPFRTISAEAPEIVIDPSRLSDVLDKILIAQDPKQAEIREKARREAWHKEGDTSPGYDARKDIKAQIICVAS